MNRGQQVSIDLYVRDHFADMLEADAVARGFEELTPEEEERIIEARRDYNAFCEYVLLDDERQSIRQEWFHREMYSFRCANRRAVILAAVEHGKTNHIVAAYLWKLGKRPKTTAGAIIMESADGKAWKTLAEIKRHIEHNTRLHRVFPALRRGATWRRNVISIDGREGRTPSIQALGVEGPINGERLTDVDMDDLLTHQNTRSRHRSSIICSWIEHEVIPRMLPCAREPSGADFAPSDNVVLWGQTWEPWDALSYFPTKPRFRELRLPSIAVRSTDEVRSPTPETESRIAWPARWPLRRLQEALDDLGEVAFRRMHLLLPRDPSKQRFRDEWIARALELGAGIVLPERYVAQRGDKLACGLDLAHADKVSRRDVNYLAELLWSPPRYRLLWLESDRDQGARWSPHTHTQKVDEYNERYPGTTFVVESNYGQQHFAEFVDWQSRARIEAVYTGSEKHDPRFGVEGIALMMERGQFVLPSGYTGADRAVVTMIREHDEARFDVHPEVAHLVHDMQTYSPDDRHIGDALAALWKAFAYLGAVQGTASMRTAPGLGARAQQKRGPIAAALRTNY